MRVTRAGWKTAKQALGVFISIDELLTIHHPWQRRLAADFLVAVFCKLVGHKLIEVAAAFDHVTGDTKSD